MKTAAGSVVPYNSSIERDENHDIEAFAQSDIKKDADQQTTQKKNDDEGIAKSFDDYEVVSNFPSYSKYWSYRFQRSNMKKMLNGADLRVEESDDAVNVLSLVNALVLTVPFSIISTLNNDFWQGFFSIDFGGCDVETRSHDLIYRNTIDYIYGCAYSAMTSLIIAIIYYFLRPKGKYFHEWWSRGRWSLLLIFVGTAASIVSLLVLFGYVAGIVALPYDRYCHYSVINGTRYQIAVSILGICVVGSIFLMF